MKCCGNCKFWIKGEEITDNLNGVEVTRNTNSYCSKIISQNKFESSDIACIEDWDDYYPKRLVTDEKFYCSLYKEKGGE